MLLVKFKITVQLALDNLINERRIGISKDDGGTGDCGIRDVRYNTGAGMTNAPHTFQAASQAVLTVVSNRTQNIIDIVTTNKHCPKKWALKAKGVEVDCPHHEGECVADLRPEDAIGDEGRMATTSARRLKDIGYPLQATCCDKDSKSEDAFQKEWGDAKLEHLVDPIHLAKAQKRHIVRKVFSNQMFTGKTASTKASSKNRFGEEIKQRCNAEISAAMQACRPDLGREKNKS